MATRGQEAQGCQAPGRAGLLKSSVNQAFLFKDTQGHFNHQTPRTEPLWQVTLSGSSHWHRLLDLISNPTDSLSDNHGNQSYSLRPGTAARLPALQQPLGVVGEQACAKGTKTQKNKSCTWLEGSSIREYSVTPANSGLECQAGGPTCWSRNVPRVAIQWALREQCYGTSTLLHIPSPGSRLPSLQNCEKCISVWEPGSYGILLSSLPRPRQLLLPTLSQRVRPGSRWRATLRRHKSHSDNHSQLLPTAHHFLDPNFAWKALLERPLNSGLGTSPTNTHTPKCRFKLLPRLPLRTGGPSGVLGANLGEHPGPSGKPNSTAKTFGVYVNQISFRQYRE